MAEYYCYHVFGE